MRLVLPAPRKPVITVAGIRVLMGCRSLVADAAAACAPRDPACGHAGLRTRGIPAVTSTTRSARAASAWLSVPA